MDEKQFNEIAEMSDIGLNEKDDIVAALEYGSAKATKLQGELSKLEESPKVTEDKEARKKLAAVKKQYKELEQKLTTLQEELSNYKNFNKRRCFENIRFLLKEKSAVKIGQIEKEAGVSLGYMSRLEKADNTAEPSAEFIVTAAKMLGVSLDRLLLTDMTSMSPTEEYLAGFLEKLNTDTIADKLEWNRESKDSLDRLETDINGNCAHPLFEYETFMEEGEGDYPDKVSRLVFTSHNFDVHTAISGDCFNLRMKNNSTLYLMDISKSVVLRVGDPDAYAKEIWICTPGDGNYYLASNKDCGQLAPLIEALFNTVKTEMQHPKIKKGVKSVLDAFIENDDLGENDSQEAGQLSIDPENMPF